MQRWQRHVGFVASMLLIGLTAGQGMSAELNFAGSMQLDYLFVPTNDRGRDITFDGFTTELSLVVAVDVSEAVSGHVKACYGCHGFEMGAAYVDLRPFDALRIRAGRFTPLFGDFPERHDPANHLTSDKPLPYDMGRMMRLRDYNMSVLPAPYVDNGMELAFHQSVGDSVDIDFSAYVVGGLRAGNGATDVDFIQSRSRELYYVDNNSSPTVGGRIKTSFYLGDGASLSMGASAMYGTYDPENKLDVLLLGADLVLRISGWSLRMEYLLRRTEMSLGTNPEESFRYGPGSDGAYADHFLKDGWYVETAVPIGDTVKLVGRFDGLRRLGNVPVSGT
ncbi:MAG: hypothetical protein ACI9MR_001905, partial [Myxococcota bacterium]